MLFRRKRHPKFRAYSLFENYRFSNWRLSSRLPWRRKSFRWRRRCGTNGHVPADAIASSDRTSAPPSSVWAKERSCADCSACAPLQRQKRSIVASTFSQRLSYAASTNDALPMAALLQCQQHPWFQVDHRHAPFASCAYQGPNRIHHLGACPLHMPRGCGRR